MFPGLPVCVSKALRATHVYILLIVSCLNRIMGEFGGSGLDSGLDRVVVKPVRSLFSERIYRGRWTCLPDRESGLETGDFSCDVCLFEDP